VLVVAGILSYYDVSLGNLAAVVLVLGGAVVVVAATVGLRPRPWDIALFLVGTVVLAGVTYGYNGGASVAYYSATTSQVHSTRFSLEVTSSTGSIDIAFTDKPGLAYAVNFTRPLPFFALFPLGSNSVTNSTTNGVFTLHVKAASDVSIALGKEFTTDVSALSDTGPIDLEGNGNLPLGNVSLTSSTGSIDAVLSSLSIDSLQIASSTGAVSLSSGVLGTGHRSAPVSMTSSTGSVNLRANIQGSDSATLTAGTDLGSISHSLTGFTVTTDTSTSLDAHTPTNPFSRGSFAISASSNLGSITLTVGVASILF
jgi:hypothetical protein